MKRICLCLLSLMLIASLLLCGCGDRGPVVMEYDGIRLTEDIYRYWISCYKAQFAYELNEENEEEIAALIDTNIKKSLICVGLFNSYGLKLSDTAREQINRAMNRLVDDIGDGNRAEFDEAISVYGIDYEGLKIAFSYEQMGSALREYLFGDNGYFSIAKEQYEEHYENTYSRVHMIYISLVDFEVDEDGLRIWDNESQSYVYTALTGVERNMQLAKAAELREKLAGVGDEAGFLALMKEYNEDPTAEEYKGGYYFSSELDYSEYVSAVTDAAQDAVIGQVKETESEIGIHFLYRVAPEEEGWSKGANEDFFEGFVDRVRDRYFEIAITDELPNVAVYQGVKDTVDFTAIPANWELYW